MQKVLLTPDVPGWAYWRLCFGIQRYGPAGVMIILHADIDRKELESYQSHLICSWSEWGRPDKTRTWALVANEAVAQPHGPSLGSTYQERMATKLKNCETAKKNLSQYKGIISASPRLLPFLRQINQNTVYLPQGVDHNTFKPTTEPFKNRAMRIGWCGKPSNLKSFSPKGYEEVLLPLMKALAVDPGVEFVVNTRTHADRLTTSEMVEWYNSIDLFLVTSCSDCGPSCALEAMACGRMVIGTNVGMLSEINTVANEKYGAAPARLVSSYSVLRESVDTVAALVCEIKRIYKDRVGAINSGRVARQVMVENYSWSVLADEWVRVLRGDIGTGEIGEAASAVSAKSAVAGSVRRSHRR
jgi:Glycosyl transferases group 1